jgi:trimethylamine--corrinoid protein Co-methyltransferase
MLALANAIAGVEINNGIGMLDCSTMLSYEQMVIDNDIVGRAIAGCREVPVNKETLHLDMIKEVGILGMGKKKGSYLGERATMLEARDFFRSSLFTSEPYDQWEAKGKKDAMTLANEQVDWILANHEPVLLDRDVSARLDKIVKDSQKGE